MSADMLERDYYEILQVHPKATLAVIKKAYRTLLLEAHPDRGGSAELTALITEAYHVLSDPERRTAYDRQYFSRAESALRQEKEREHTGEKAKEPKAAPPISNLIVLCPRCRTKNRVQSQELLSVAKCSRCGQSLSRMPSVLEDLRENLLSAIARRFGPLRPVGPLKGAGPDKLRIGLAAGLLLVSALAIGYSLTDRFSLSGDPIEATDVLRKAGEFHKAAALLQRALDHEPGNPRLHEKLGDIYVREDMYPEALAEYSQAIKLNPQNSYLYTLTGNVYLTQKKLPEAELSYKQALRLDPDQSPALVALGNVYARQERFDEAANLYQQALKDNGQPRADILYNLGMVYQWDGRREDAEKAFKQALIADPDHRSSMVSLASLYYETGQYDQAAAQLIKANALKHEDLNLHLRLADIYERQGHTQAAIKEWELCLDQGKDNPAVLERAKRALTRLSPTGA